MAFPKLSRGQVLGTDFKIERLIGVGGMGAVYRALQMSTGRTRALKLMRVEFANDPKLRQRFAEEAMFGARIKSDHVVEVVAAGIDAETGFPWLAMEYLEGEDLAARLSARGPCSPREASTVLKQACHALGAAHAVSIVHRDLKPANIFLAKTARADAHFTVKILDFGLAKAVADTTSLTEPLGTLFYMAPEQLRSGSVSPATDVWALGLCAFELLTGRRYWLCAHRHFGISELTTEIGTGISTPATERAARLGFLGSLPDGFDNWLARACALEPSQRFPDAATAFAALQPLLRRAYTAERRERRARTRAPDAPRVPDGGRRSTSTTGALVLVLGGVAALLGLFLFAAMFYLALLSQEAPRSDTTQLTPSNPGANSDSDEPKTEWTSVPPAPAPAADDSPPPATSVEEAPRNGGPGFLTVMCVPGCDSVTAGGRNLGPSPIIRAALPPGPHGVRLRRSSTKKSFAVTIVSGQTTARRVQMD
ncbi:MAG: serine/threonine protein kinase [Myxococcales bacterium]|nr:serine/threonine protein kinase [Myxococcales bacterium]